MRLRLFSNEFARHNFYFLLFGFTIIFSALLYVVLGLQDLNRHSSYNKEMVNQVIRVIGIASVAPTYDVPHLISAMNNQFVQASIDPAPLAGSEKLTSFAPQRIRELMQKNSNEVKISYPLGGDLWLNVVTQNLGDTAWLWISFYILAAILAIMLVLLCAWIVNRLTLPLEFFSSAAQRFEADINAPALPEMGRGQLRATIHIFNNMQAKIKKLVSDRMQILAAISHDLRTPITRLRLRVEDVADHDQEQYKKISNDLDELEGMVNGVLRFARDDSKQEAKEKFDLNALLDTLCNDMIDSGFTVAYLGLEKRVPFFGRVNALRRAFTNLVDNAVKYGQVAQVTLREATGQVVVEIIDQGKGIPVAEMERIFDPFYRVEKSRCRETGGVGLGLTVTRDIIQDHDGTIMLTNLPEGGLKVTVTLPVKDIAGITLQ